MGSFKQKIIVLGALALMALSGCEELKSEKPSLPPRAVSAANSTVTGSGGEVGVATSVTVRLIDSKGFGVQKIAPVVTAVNGLGTPVTGLTSSCGASDIYGTATCTVTSPLPGTYTLKVTSPVTYTGGSVTFTQITRSLSFSTSPSASTTAGSAFATQPVVQLLDRVGNLNTSGTETITVALTSAGGATLSGTTSVAAVAGVATFAGLAVDKSGSYTLTASSGSITTGVSSSFTINAGAAAKLGFTTQPSASTAANIAFAQQPIVAVQDSQGNTVTSSSCQISLALTTTPAGTHTLSGTNVKTAISGVADFAGLGLRISTYDGGTGYVITASGVGSCSGLTAAATDPFDITLAGVPRRIVLSTLPSDSALNETFVTQPVVQVLDINDDLVTTDNQTIVTVVKSAGGSGNLTGATSLTVTNGVASFAGLEITSAAPADAGTYTLSYDATNPSGYDFTALTDDVDISDDGMVGASLQFYVQPQSVAINEKIPNFQVKILDAGGHLCTACTDTITLGYYYGTGTLTDGGAGTMTRTAVEGVATFDNFSIDTSGIKQFSASASLGTPPAVVTAYSNVFSIKSYGTANKLSFGTQPAAGASRDLTAWATQPTVRIEDSAGNLVVSDNSTKVTLSCVNPSSGCTLLGTTTVTAVNGIATFTNLRTAETALTNVVLEANSSNNSSLSSTQSNSFNGNLGSPYSLTFSQQPGDAWSPQPKVQVLDNQGHLVSDATDAVTMTCVSATGGACSLTGTTSVNASSGVASFTDLGTSVNGLTNIVIKASSGTLVSAQSSAFDGAP